MPPVSKRLAGLPSYPMAEIPRLKRELRSQGVDVIDLGVGDADLPPPPAAVEALARSAADPVNSRYAFQLGLVPLREEIAAWSAERFGVTLDPLREILPLIGSKEGIFHLSSAFLDPGDVAIIPDPGYQAYLGGTVLAGGEPYLVPLCASDDYLVVVEDLPPDVVRRARILYLNYPNNPTAAVAPREYLHRVVDFCRRNDIVLAYDNAYSEVAFDGYRPPSILEIDGASEVAVEFHSFSKTYNMTGWRIGWAAGTEALISALTKVKTFADTGVPLFVQHAALAALRSHRDWLPGNLEVFRSRRDVAVPAFRSAGLDVGSSAATMYLWARTPGGQPSEPFARRILAETGVALLPGSALGSAGEGHVRIALTVPEARLREAAERIAGAIRLGPGEEHPFRG